MFSETRRFIAGARCPNCQCEDRTVVYRRDGEDHRECVACGWLERSPDSGAARRAVQSTAGNAVLWVEPPAANKDGG
ncbi:MAG TPA: YheV family putative zinc ribbon protein [Porticoccaceae bacterium]|nr:YheV family putative zinc ribbon protein [Porticoccaceae bacterium]